MQEYRSQSGERRVWYEGSEIDQIMTDELTKASLLPNASDDDVAVKIESFVEGYLDLEFDQYAQLESNTLGITRFFSGKPPKIEINRDLTVGAFDTEDKVPGTVGRWRSTVAHEIGHVLLHRQLYDVSPMQPTLFPGGRSDSSRSSSLMRCLKRDVGYCVGSSDWREVQANMAIGALLMPKPVIGEVVAAEEERLLLGARPIDENSPKLQMLVSAVARRFMVSKAAARIRIEGLGRVERWGQSSLGFSHESAELNSAHRQ